MKFTLQSKMIRQKSREVAMLDQKIISVKVCGLSINSRAWVSAQFEINVSIIPERLNAEQNVMMTMDLRT